MGGYMNRKMLSASCLAVVLSLGSAASIQAAMHDSATTTTVSVQKDQELAKKIQDKIGEGWFSRGYEKVKVEVNNGDVTLNGSVNSVSDKEKVQKEVRNIDGVKKLTSNLTVEQKDHSKVANKFPQDTFATSADEQLNKKIRENVSEGWVWDSYKGVSLNTNHGVVTLKGTVKNVDDAQKLVKEVQKIDGVKEVKSNLTFEK